MARNFINNRLVTARRFAPGEKSPPATATAPLAEDAPVPPAAGLETILQKEDSRTKVQVAKRDVRETGRRREEVLRDLGEIVANLEAEQTIVKEKLARFDDLRRTIAGLPEDVGAERLGKVKAAVREAHIELVKHHRESLTSEERGGGIDWTTLDLGQLTRIGFGLGWPVIVGFVIGALIVSATLAVVFGTG